MISQKKKRRQHRAKHFMKEERKRVLKEVGILRMRQRGLRPQRPEMPDLTVVWHIPTSDRVGNGFAKKPVEGAAQFPVGQSHKQGPMLVTRSDRLEDMGGRKT